MPLQRDWWPRLMARARILLLLGAASAGGLILGDDARAGSGAVPPALEYQVEVAPSVGVPVFVERPAGCRPTALLIVFHGVGRDALPYLRHASPLTEAVCAVAVAPQFDQERFPRDLYQYGGVGTGGARTVDDVQPIVLWADRTLGLGSLPVVLLGHSAGAQFVDRVAAYTALDARCIVVANPSTWALPSLDRPLPFGFGGDPDAERDLRRYLSRPIVVLLGQDDTGQEDLAMSSQARAQGADRLERGRNAFRAAVDLARARGWPLGWRLVEVPGVGHHAAAMFASPEARSAVERCLR